ncbi:hypothetical protein D018_1172B, partial [Vibrio parahaemolyticus VP2007-007]
SRQTRHQIACCLLG